MERVKEPPDEPVPERFTGSRLVWFLALVAVVVVVIAAAVLLGMVL